MLKGLRDIFAIRKDRTEIKKLKHEVEKLIHEHKGPNPDQLKRYQDALYWATKSQT